MNQLLSNTIGNNNQTTFFLINFNSLLMGIDINVRLIPIVVDMILIIGLSLDHAWASHNITCDCK